MVSILMDRSLIGLAVELDLAIGSLLIAVGAILGLSLLFKPSVVIGERDSTALVLGMRVLGLAIMVGGFYFGYGIFKSKNTLAPVESTPIVDAPARDEEEEHKVLAEMLKAIAPKEYTEVSSPSGKKLFLWTIPSTGEMRVLDNRAVIGQDDYVPEDLGVIVKEAHALRSENYLKLYPMYAYDKVAEDIIPNIFPADLDLSDRVAVSNLYDPPPSARWYSSKMVLWVLERAPRPGAIVRKSHLTRWGKTAAEIFPQALQNLEREFAKTRSKIEKEQRGNVTVFTDESTTLSAYPCSPNFYPVVSQAVGGENFFFSVPSFSMILVMPVSKEAFLSELTEQTNAITGKLSKASTISSSIFLCTPKGIEEYRKK